MSPSSKNCYDTILENKIQSEGNPIKSVKNWNSFLVVVVVLVFTITYLRRSSRINLSFNDYVVVE